MITLFEYGEWQKVEAHEGLMQSLSLIHKELFPKEYEEVNEKETDKHYQPYLSFSPGYIRARNYSGFIQHGDKLIEIYPKVFRGIKDAAMQKQLMLEHVFYWFSYCRKWRFPFQQVALNTRDIDSFPELIIYQIAQQFYSVISEQPLSLYQHVEEALQTPKGSINFGRYINQQIVHGAFHQIECDHEPLMFDNTANRVLKHCARLLLNHTKFTENYRILQDVIFLLDEVEDIACTVNDIGQIRFNVFFQDYEPLMDSCRLILNQQLYANDKYDHSQWCLLFPMEYIFEDFLAGFLELKFSDRFKVDYQKSDKYLSDEPKVFQMQHDIYLEEIAEPKRRIIIDAKYKIRSAEFKQDPKKGIAQADLYQMVSYAYKRGCTDVILVYPNTGEALIDKDTFIIKSGFEQETPIKVTAVEIPFWSMSDFKGMEQKLEERLDAILQKQETLLSQI